MTIRRLLSVLAMGLLCAASATEVAAKEPPQWLVAHLIWKYRDRPDVEYVRFNYALVDLNGDGRDEAVVYETSSGCGTGGCGVTILARHGERWLEQRWGGGGFAPIMILPTRTHGWRDLASLQAGGGITHPYEARLRFNGRIYERVVPTDWTGDPPPPPIHGRVLIKDATIPLPPSAFEK